MKDVIIEEKLEYGEPTMSNNFVITYRFPICLEILYSTVGVLKIKKK